MPNPSSRASALRMPRILERFLPAAWHRTGPVVPVVRLTGAIGMSAPFRPGLYLANVARSLERAFSMKSAPAVALIINSPGGAAAQSHLIFRRIRALAQEKNKHVFAFVEDVAASGGYMIACAADEIIADPASLVGSIGVVSAGFGFDRLIERIGVERRVHTAGTQKMILDPFRPEQPQDVAHLEALQRDIHAMFIDVVRTRRKEALKASDEILFSGAFWIGSRGLELGLVDQVGDLRQVLRARYGDEVRTPLMAPGGWLTLRRSGPGVEVGRGPHMGQAGLGAEFAAGLLAGVEERALWARYGL